MNEQDLSKRLNAFHKEAEELANAVFEMRSELKRKGELFHNQELLWCVGHQLKMMKDQILLVEQQLHSIKEIERLMR